MTFWKLKNYYETYMFLWLLFNFTMLIYMCIFLCYIALRIIFYYGFWILLFMILKMSLRIHYLYPNSTTMLLIYVLPIKHLKLVKNT